jgi:alkylhydroperoxidase/carboxymuconolactone decarboxylase family protein YurZ
MPAKTTKPSEDVNNLYGYSEMEWAAQLDPAYAAARVEVRRLSVGEEGVLSVKVKELIVMGILASRGLQYRVEAHMRRAIEYGATKEELFEAMKAAAVPGGGRRLQCGRSGPPSVGTGRRFPAASRASSAGESRPATAHLPFHTAPAGHRRPAMKVPDTRRPEDVRYERHGSGGVSRLPETHGSCAPARFLARCLAESFTHRCAVTPPSEVGR